MGMNADWEGLSVILVMVGFEATVLGFIPFASGGEDVEAMMIIAFLCYAVVAVLVLLGKFAELGFQLVVDIINCVLLFAAGIFLIIGVALVGGDNNGNNYNNFDYVATLEMVGCLCALVAAVFIIIKLVTGGGGGGGGAGRGRTAPAAEH